MNIALSINISLFHKSGASCGRCIQLIPLDRNSPPGAWSTGADSHAGQGPKGCTCWLSSAPDLHAISSLAKCQRRRLLQFFLPSQQLKDLALQLRTNSRQAGRAMGRRHCVGPKQLAHLCGVRNSVKRPTFAGHWLWLNCWVPFQQWMLVTCVFGSQAWRCDGKTATKSPSFPLSMATLTSSNAKVAFSEEASRSLNMTKHHTRRCSESCVTKECVGKQSSHNSVH